MDEMSETLDAPLNIEKIDHEIIKPNVFYYLQQTGCLYKIKQDVLLPTYRPTYSYIHRILKPHLEKAFKFSKDNPKVLVILVPEAKNDIIIVKHFKIKMASENYDEKNIVEILEKFLKN